VTRLTSALPLTVHAQAKEKYEKSGRDVVESWKALEMAKKKKSSNFVGKVCSGLV
jgi:hypothetical protein